MLGQYNYYIDTNYRKLIDLSLKINIDISENWNKIFLNNLKTNNLKLLPIELSTLNIKKLDLRLTSPIEAPYPYLHIVDKNDQVLDYYSFPSLIIWFNDDTYIDYVKIGKLMIEI